MRYHISSKISDSLYLSLFLITASFSAYKKNASLSKLILPRIDNDDHRSEYSKKMHHKSDFSNKQKVGKGTKTKMILRLRTIKSRVGKKTNSTE